MRNNRNSSLAIILIIIFCNCLICWPQNNEYYYLNSYIGNYPDSFNIQMAKIDLGHKIVVSTTNVPIQGELGLKIPLLVRKGNKDYRIVFAINGLSGKYTSLLPNIETEYAIYDNLNRNITLDTLVGIDIFGFNTFVGDSIGLKYEDNSLPTRGVSKGVLTIDNQNKMAITFRGEDRDDIIKPSIGIFNNYRTLFLNNSILFRNISKDGIYLLSLNTINNLLIDSLKICDSINYSYLFGLSESDSLVYAFYLNYCVTGGPQSLQKLRIDSSYVKIIRVQSLSAIDSIYIPNPPIDSGYTFGEIGTCERIGPYFVYYFFNGEDYRYFSPAMLFIFDTRTNQATWLRVGWR